MFRREDPLRRELVNGLECFICKRMMKPPILMCVGGHNVCERHQHCTCEDKISTVRNKTLENLCFYITYACKYENQGCKYKDTLDNTQEHEESCTYQPCRCPYDMCYFRGCMEHMEAHFLKEHQSMVSTSDGKMVFSINMYEVIKLINLKNRYYFFRCWKSQLDTYVHTALFQVGTTNNSPYLEHTVSISSPDQTVSFTYPILSYDEYFELKISRIVKYPTFFDQYVRVCSKNNKFEVNLKMA